MGVIVDTSVWVDLARGRLEPSFAAQRIGNDRVFLAPPILAELEAGLPQETESASRSRHLGALSRIKGKPCLIMDHATGEVFGRLVRSSGPRKRAADPDRHTVWVAALALQHGFSILTRRPARYEHIPGLRVVVV